jgi:hypothetical protein
LDYSSSTFQFYYDFEERIYTNLDLTQYLKGDLKIIFNTVGNNEVKVKCMLGANSGKRSTKTPVINDYILKLKGQYMRG